MDDSILLPVGGLATFDCHRNCSNQRFRAGDTYHRIRLRDAIEEMTAEGASAANPPVSRIHAAKTVSLGEIGQLAESDRRARCARGARMVRLELVSSLRDEINGLATLLPF